VTLSWQDHETDRRRQRIEQSQGFDWFKIGVYTLVVLVCLVAWRFFEMFVVFVVGKLP
jgi:hypothetical protein